MSAHPGSQCAKCGADVHGEELCGWCEADVLRVALAEAQKERDEYRSLWERINGTSKRDIAERQREACAKFIEQASLADGRPVHAARCREAPLVTEVKL